MPKSTIKEAISEVLKKVDSPLSAKEIYEKIIEFGYYQFNTDQPIHVVSVQIRRHCEGLDFPSANPNKYFQLLNDGRYWLKDVPVPGATQEFITAEQELKRDRDALDLKSIVEDLKWIHKTHAAAFKQSIINQLRQIEPYTFEKFSRKLLEAYGFVDVKVTKATKDGGIDGNGKLKVGITYLNVAFQCKRWKGNVGRPEIDKFRGAIQGDYEQGIIFTTAKFTPDAASATSKKGAVPIILIDGSTLIDIMIEKRFGVEAETMPVYINALDQVLTDDL